MEIVKIGKLPDDKLVDLKIILLTSAKNHLGIANLPNENDLNLIVQFLKSKYFDFDLNEIAHAITLYSSGEIIVENKPYGVLSTLFLSEVLNEYRQLRAIWKKIAEQKENKTKLLNAPIADPIKEGEENYNFLVNYFFEKNELPLAFDWESVYFHLERIKEIDLSIDDKKDFFNNEKNDYIEKIDYYKNVFAKKAEVKEWLELISDKNLLSKHCRKKLVHLYFTNQLKKPKAK